MNKCLTIIRGASGSGKSWLASAIREQSTSAIWLASDDYRTDEWGTYKYSVESNNRIWKALENDVTWHMKNQAPQIIVEATFIGKRASYRQIVSLIDKYVYEFQEIIVRRWPLMYNNHDVPDEVKLAMQKKIEL